MVGLHHLADQSPGTDHRHVQLHPLVPTDTDVDGGGEVAGPVVGHLGRHRLQVADERQVEEGAQLLHGLLGVLFGRLLLLQLPDLRLELLVLLADRSVVDRAGQKAAHRLDDVIDARAHRCEGVGRHRLHPGGDAMEPAAGVQGDDGHRGQQQDEQGGAGAAGPPRHRHGR